MPPRTQRKPSVLSRAASASPAHSPAPPAAIRAVRAALEDLKAHNVVLIPLAGKASFADWLVVATGTSGRHLSSLADAAETALARADAAILGREGDAADADWVCLDAADVVVHLFLPEARLLYNLEKLWAFPADLLDT